MKKYKHGVVLGKFMPLHYGHQFLINEAIQNCEKVTVIVCTRSIEPINGKLRYEWMTKTYEKEIKNNIIKVVHLEENWVPQEPKDCKSVKIFYSVWAQIIITLAGEKPDVFFSSENYGEQVAKELRCKHEMIDHRRIKYPVSGTKCRKRPFENWEYMNPIVRKHFSKKILIIGTESTGKSTLATELSKWYSSKGFQVANVQEWARKYIDEKLNGDMTRLKETHINLFGKKQWEAVTKEDKQIIFSDTDAMVSKVFLEEYYKSKTEKLDEVINKEEWDLILFTQPDVPWIDDSQRNLPHKREQLTNRIKYLLDEKKWSYVEIKGSWKERWETAVISIDKLLENKN